MPKYTVSCKIKTDYSAKELEEVMDKLLGIPGLQYEDCEYFDYEELEIRR